MLAAANQLVHSATKSLTSTIGKEILTSLQWVISFINSNQDLSLDFLSRFDISNDQLNQCFMLIKHHVSHFYADAWDPNAKMTELSMESNKFILLTNSKDRNIVAFAMFQFSLEEHAYHDYNQPVGYCYELHVIPSFQNRRIGSFLMKAVIYFTRLKQMDKLMLTVCKDNTKAVKFYQNLGFSIDDTSPSQFTDEITGLPIDVGYEIMSI